MEDECQDAYMNPKCPYITQINRHETSLAEIKTDIGWLKKGYWIQTALSFGTFLTIIAVAYWLLTGQKLPF